MQKVFRRTIMAEKQVARRLAKKRDKYKRDVWKNTREQNQLHRQDESKTIQAAKVARREDYELGPLAPRRDVGDQSETYGSVNMQRMQGRVLHPKAKWDILNLWGGKFLNLRVGDRVVILEGRDKGKIGLVDEIDLERAECKVTGLNMMDIAVPSYMIPDEDQDKRPTRSIEQPVSLKHIRLVHALADAETNVVRDVIIKQLVQKDFWFEQKTGRSSWKRVIPGLNINIPWPERKSKPKSDHPGDTLRMDVETRTFIPSLLSPPMPGSVIDELRNRYSIFRTRHEPEYIEKKEKEEQEKQERKQLAKKMRTPLNIANRKARKERKKLGKGKLTPDMLEKIGQVMASKRNGVLDAVGVSREQTVPMAV